MKTHTFIALDGKSGRHKRKYKVNVDLHLEGYCHVPDKKVEYEIYVDPYLGGVQHLEAAVHEAVHALLPKDGETRVEWLGHELARFLWRVGYRRPRR